MNQNVQYREFYSTWKKAYPTRKGQTVQFECNEFWNSHKGQQEPLKKKLAELVQVIAKSRQRNLITLLNFTPRKVPVEALQSKEVLTETIPQASPIATVDLADTNNSDSDECVKTPPKKATPWAQVQRREKLSEVQVMIDNLLEAKGKGLEPKDRHGKTLDQYLAEKEKLKKNLKRLKASQRASKRYRDSTKAKLQKLQEQNPEALMDLRRETVGRPHIELEYPELHATIIALVSETASADGKRRTDILNSCATLDGLLASLQREGIEVKRSTLYTRLMPVKGGTAEAKRHKRALPIKLCRPQNDLHKEHQDGHFCSAAVKF